jgi:putative DNA methylase
MSEIKAPKKLIEVALPLDAINTAAAYEKLPGIGSHPRGLHQWWARRPLTAARAFIFAQLVNDPGYERSLGRGVNKEKAAIERDRLLSLIERLAQWHNTNDKDVLEEARREIWKSWRETCQLNRNHPLAAELFNPDNLPAFHDPFAGGGALPLEAQRLGLESFGSDLNPVPVLINKAMIEVPPLFSGRRPVGPKVSRDRQEDLHEDWSGSRGLAEDLRRYGTWISNEAARRLGHLYPDVVISKEMSEVRPDLARYKSQRLKVVSWLWVRTVRSPNPAYSHVHVPLASSFILATKEGKNAWVEPVVTGDQYTFLVKTGRAPSTAGEGTKAGGRGNFRCLLSNSPIDGKYIKSEGQAGRVGIKLMAIIAEGNRERVYLSPRTDHEKVALEARPTWKPDIEFAKNSRHMTPWVYGFTRFSDLFTSRQLMALAVYSDLISEAFERIKTDALRAGMSADDLAFEGGGDGARAYAEALCLLLSFGVSRLADFNNALCRWNPSNQKIMNLFGRQAVPMVWDFGEANILAEVVGGWPSVIAWQADCVETLNGTVPGHSMQLDAAVQTVSKNKIISTDPPYYDNVPYADLADFFYVWLRRTLRSIFPSVFATLAVPKAEELVADSFRHASKETAENFFLEGMTRAIHQLAYLAHPAFPVTIYYAFKQAETNNEATASTGWETFLEAVLKAGFTITGTWPTRSEQVTRMRGMDSNALASSIVLVCRKREGGAPTVGRREFIRELNSVLPEALLDMTHGGVNSPVAPVDLSQAIIGPGMAIFSKYEAVLEANGEPMSVRTALTLINRFFAEDDFDHDTQFCLDWFAHTGWSVGKFGEADVMARAKGTSVDGLSEAGVAETGGGRIRLLRWAEYPADWAPEGDQRLPIWEALHQLIRALKSEGESTAEPVRALAYRLYTLCERKGWAEDARAYNELVTSWSGIEAASLETGHTGTQAQLDLE